MNKNHANKLKQNYCDKLIEKVFDLRKVT
jgi:hypothetical protein